MNLLFIIVTVLQSLLTTLEQKTLQTNFTISIAQQQEQPMTYSGDLTMHGKQFALNMLSTQAAYDGKTLYTYSEDMDELSLSTPSEEELLQTNPFLYAQALLPGCQYTETVIGDKTQITLTPTSSPNSPIASSPIAKFVLRLTTATLLPTSIEIHEDDGNTTTLRLSNAQFSDSIPTFTIEKEGAFINDLR